MTHLEDVITTAIGLKGGNTECVLNFVHPWWTFGIGNPRADAVMLNEIAPEYFSADHETAIEAVLDVVNQLVNKETR